MARMSKGAGKKPGMIAEAEASPQVVAALLDRSRTVLAEIARAISTRDPALVTTVARGSSDHAATFFQYLMPLVTGLPVAKIGASLASVYERPLQLDRALHVSVSQSGASPDVLAVQRAAKAGGALTLAIVNVEDSPLAAEADLVLSLGAGPELSVAATKTYVASCAALAAIAGGQDGSGALMAALDRLPEALDGALALPRPDMTGLARAEHLFCVGRGPALAIAAEAALKFKEISGQQAEPFSLAEIMHGPLTLVGPGFPVVGIIADDQALPAAKEALQRLQDLGADLCILSQADLPGRVAALPSTGSPWLDPLVGILPIYRMVHAGAIARNRDPEAPRHLQKVTRTA